MKQVHKHRKLVTNCQYMSSPTNTTETCGHKE
jgi:hypothetical protein